MIAESEGQKADTNKLESNANLTMKIVELKTVPYSKTFLESFKSIFRVKLEHKWI